MPAIIRQTLCREDNFAVLIHDPATGRTAAIDAPDEGAIRKVLAETGWSLTDILVTHEHFDHVEGIPGLKKDFGCRVIAPKKATRVPDVDVRVGEGDTVAFGSLSASVMETPGHCPDHLAFWFESLKTVFVGDTLFALGCGRMFGSTAVEFQATLARLAMLPDETSVYCGHEYTLSNARFALTVDRGNEALRLRALDVENRHARGEVTLPTTIAEEKRTNPFLRWADPAIRTGLGLEHAADAAVFATLREAKNGFRV
jgi:hydroxyacylglutathione hydrolase